MNRSAARWPDALAAGLASSMRTFAAPGMLAARGRITGRPRAAVLLLTGVELASDKLPVPDRTDPPGLASRGGAGAYAGWSLAGPAGAAAGTVGALAGSFATFRARKLIGQATGLPDPAIAVGEDLIAFSVAAAATRETDATEEEAPQRSVLRDVGRGLAAGLAGTALMTLAQGAEYQLTSATPSMAPADVASKVSKRLGLGKIKRRHKPAVNQAMHWGYGTSWGIPYGLAVGSRGARPEISGPVFGLLVWGAALAHQPALGIAEVPWKRSLESLGSEALFHLVYGVGAGAALRALRG